MSEKYIPNKDKAYIGAHIDPALNEWIEVERVKQGRSKSGQIEYMLKEYRAMMDHNRKAMSDMSVQNRG